MPSGSVGHLGGLGGFRFELEVAAQRLDRRFEPHARLGLFDLDATGALAGLVELPLGGGAARGADRRGGRRARAPRRSAGGAGRAARRGAPRSTWRWRSTSSLSRSTAARLRSIATRRSRGLGAGDGVGLQPALGLLDAAFEELLALVQAGVAHLEVLATRGQHGGCGASMPGPRLAASPGRLGLGLLVGLERRHAAPRARRCGHARARAARARRRRRVRRSRSRRRPRAARPARARAPRRGGEPGIVGVEAAGELGLGWLRGVQLGLARPQRGVACARARPRPRLEPLDRLPPARPPSRRRRPHRGASRSAEPVALGGDDDRVGIGDGAVDGVGPVERTRTAPPSEVSSSASISPSWPLAWARTCARTGSPTRPA